MLEVLAALMISFAFLMGTLNALAITALMQVKAERQAQAMYWIQRDLESVRAESTSSSLTGICTATTFAGSYAESLQNAINSNTAMTVTNPVTLDTTTPPVQTQVVSPSQRLLVNRPYRLVRVINRANDNPNVFKVSYYVGEPDDNQTTYTPTASPPVIPRIKTDGQIASLYTEILPTKAIC